MISGNKGLTSFHQFAKLPAEIQGMIVNVSDNIRDLKNARLANTTLAHAGALAVKDLKVSNASDLKAALKRFRPGELHRLDARNARLKDDELLLLRDYFDINDVQLAGNTLGPDSGQMLSFCQIEKLNLNQNNMGITGARHLAQSGTLKTAMLAHNNIQDEGAKYLSASQTIEVLNLANNGLTDTGIQHLSHLKQLKKTQY